MANDESDSATIERIIDGRGLASILRLIAVICDERRSTS